MKTEQATLWVRMNGAGHAFGRELGCDCGRCQTVNYNIAPPPNRLAEFAGWPDPPNRANTSASLLIGNREGNVAAHILVDVGAGVPDSLAGALIPGLDHVTGVFLTHWHGDHAWGLSQLGEGLRRTAHRREQPFFKIPLYCTLPTYHALRDRIGLAYVLERCYRFQEIVPELPIELPAGQTVIRLTAISVKHGAADGAVIYVAEALKKKVVLAWDIETPDAAFPSGYTNAEVFRRHATLLQNADLHLQECNSWAIAGRGHCTYQAARAYFEVVQAKRTLLVHLSGHEDGPGNPGYGWTDAQWQAAAKPDGIEVAQQGMVLRV